MVIAYLDKMREDFEGQRICLKELILACENKIKENDKFIRILEESNDPNYEAFSPRQLNTFNRRKIAELHGEQATLAEDLAELKDQLGETDRRIEELSAVIRSAKESAVQKTEKPKPELAALVHQVELCRQLVDVDPVRCKQELSMIEKLLRDLLQDSAEETPADNGGNEDAGLSLEEKN